MSEAQSDRPPADWGIAASDLAVIVLSCDKYCDLWAPFAHCFRRAWPDCPFSVYLFANQKRWEGTEGIQTVLSGEDRDWSSSIKACVQQLRQEYVLVLFDDVLLSQRVERSSLAPLLGWLARERPTYLRFRRVPNPDERVTSEIGRYKETTLYRTAVFGIWRRTALDALLVPGESAWQFEYNSPARASADPAFYGTYRNDVLPYVHAVEKGKWVPAAHRWYLRRGGPPPGPRAVMGTREMLANRFAHSREFFFNHAPSSWRPRLIRMTRRARQMIGILAGRQA
jgi:hypothetical protein